MVVYCLLPSVGGSDLALGGNQISEIKTRMIDSIHCNLCFNGLYPSERSYFLLFIMVPGILAWMFDNDGGGGRGAAR